MFFQVLPVPSGILSKTLPSSTHKHTHTHKPHVKLHDIYNKTHWLYHTAPWPWQATCCASPSIRPQYSSVTLCNRIKITVSAKFDNLGQSFGAHHNQMNTSVCRRFTCVTARHLLRVFIKIMHRLSIATAIIQNVFRYVIPRTLHARFHLWRTSLLHSPFMGTNDLALPALWNSNSFYSEMTTVAQPDALSLC